MHRLQAIGLREEKAMRVDKQNGETATAGSTKHEKNPIIRGKIAPEFAEIWRRVEVKSLVLGNCQCSDRPRRVREVEGCKWQKMQRLNLGSGTVAVHTSAVSAWVKLL